MRTWAWKRWSGVLALAAVLAPPSGAAPPVSPERRVPRVGHYDEAARELGMREWGTVRQHNRAIHAFLRLDAGRAVLGIALPPGTPPGKADQWLGRLADGMGWSDVDLYSTVQPEAVYLRAVIRGGVRTAGPGRSRMPLDLQRLGAHLGEITPKPVLLAVRSSGSDFLQGTPAPVVQGKYEGDAYLFYRLGSGPVGGPSRAATPGPLVLEYGISPRWFAAAASTALMWLLFPFVALFTTRAHLQRQSRMDAKERLQSYRRWQRGVIFVTIAGALASLFAVGVGKLGYLMGAARAPFFLIAYLAPVSSLSLAGRLIGLPLERDAWPQRRDLPWYKAAGTELVSIGITLLMVAMMLVLTGGGTGMSAPRLRSVLLGIGALFAVSAVCGLIAAACYLGLKRRGHWVAPTDPEAPEELALPIREFSARLDYPVNQVLLSQKRGGFGALNAPVVVKDKVVVPADLADALHPDQVAALVAATALAQPRSRGDKLLSYAGIVLMLLPVLVIGPMIYNVATGRPRPTAMMPLLFLVYPLVMIVSMLTARRQQRRQEEADLRVADALGEPRQFTQALQQLEELQAATTGLDPAATRTPAFTQRRTRLERRLGLD